MAALNRGEQNVEFELFRELKQKINKTYFGSGSLAPVGLIRWKNQEDQS